MTTSPDAFTAGELARVLEDAREQGFLGPGPVEPHVQHALAFATAAEVVPARALDLGSGGGLPGLVLAQTWPATTWVLLDAGQRRTAFLRAAVARLGLDERVVIVEGRAEAAGRDPSLRATFELVVARSFGGPAVTAECAAPFLRVGGHLVVSEPPEAEPDRWPVDGLHELGLRPAAAVAGPPRFQVLEQARACPDRYPRRTGVPAKRPLWLS